MPTTVAASTVPQVEVVITEAVTAAAVARWRNLLNDVVALHPTHMIIDLAGCSRLDAVGIDLLVEIHRRVWADGGRLTLRGMSERLYRLLEIARVDRVLQTAFAPPGYQPQHRAVRNPSPAAVPQREDGTAPAGEVRWWEAVPSA